jgi:hypothetical protein
MKKHRVRTVDEFLELLENDSEENPIGLMQDVGAKWHGAWRYTILVNSLYFIIEGSLSPTLLGKSPEDTYTVCYSMIPKIAKEQAMKFSGEVIDVPYSEEDEKWLRFTKLENAAHFLLSLYFVHVSRPYKEDEKS